MPSSELFVNGHGAVYPASQSLPSRQQIALWCAAGELAVGCMGEGTVLDTCHETLSEHIGDLNIALRHPETWEAIAAECGKTGKVIQSIRLHADIVITRELVAHLNEKMPGCPLWVSIDASGRNHLLELNATVHFTDDPQHDTPEQPASASSAGALRDDPASATADSSSSSVAMAQFGDSRMETRFKEAQSMAQPVPQAMNVHSAFQHGHASRPASDSTSDRARLASMEELLNGDPPTDFWSAVSRAPSDDSTAKHDSRVRIASADSTSPEASFGSSHPAASMPSRRASIDSSADPHVVEVSVSSSAAQQAPGAEPAPAAPPKLGNGFVDMETHGLFALLGKWGWKVLFQPIRHLGRMVEGNDHSSVRYRFARVVLKALPAAIGSAFQFATGVGTLVEMGVVLGLRLTAAAVAGLFGATQAKRQFLHHTPLDPRCKRIPLTSPTAALAPVLEDAARWASMLAADEVKHGKKVENEMQGAMQKAVGAAIERARQQAAEKGLAPAPLDERTQEKLELRARHNVLAQFVPRSLLPSGSERSPLPGIRRMFLPEIVAGGWSSLGITVQVSHPDGSDEPHIHLQFAGMEAKLGRFKCVLANIFGIKASQFELASRIVREFTQMHPGRVSLSGFSMGGALATYAGIKNRVSVRTYNGLGFHPQIIQMFDHEELANADILNFHVASDPVIDLTKALFLRQIGTQCVVPSTHQGHEDFDGLEDKLAKLARLANPNLPWDFQSAQ